MGARPLHMLRSSRAEVRRVGRMSGQFRTSGEEQSGWKTGATVKAGWDRLWQGVLGGAERCMSSKAAVSCCGEGVMGMRRVCAQWTAGRLHGDSSASIPWICGRGGGHKGGWLAMKGSCSKSGEGVGWLNMGFVFEEEAVPKRRTQICAERCGISNQSAS